jgi:hypothetical protein
MMTNFDVHALKIRDWVDEFATIVQGARRHLFRTWDTIVDSNASVIFTECRGLLYDTCTVCRRDVRIHKDVRDLHTEGRSENAQNKEGISLTCSVKYSKSGTYLHPFTSIPL